MLVTFILLYLLASIAIGLYAATRVKNTADYAVAGRSLPLAVVIATTFATWFGAETVLGVPAKFVGENLGGIVEDPFGAGMCLVLVGLFFARKLYLRNIITIGDYYRQRYGRLIEVLCSLIIIFSYLGWVGAQVTALGLVFNLLSQGAISMAWGMTIGTMVVLVYTLYGGMWSVALTDFVQMIVITLGLLAIAWYAAGMVGGAGKVIDFAAREGKFQFWPTGGSKEWLFFIGAAITMALGSIPQQDVFQRVNSSKNETVAVWGTTLGGVSYFFFAAVPLFLAYTATIIDPEMVGRLMEQDSQLILPTLILQYMPFAAQVVFFGALLSVIMSTASGTLLAPSVTFSENVLRGFFPQMRDHQFLWATRVTVVIFTVLVTWYATSTESTIHQMVENAYRITLAGAFVPLAAGLFWKRANNLGAALAIVCGLATWILFELFVPEGDIEPQLFGLAASALGMLVGGLFGRPSHHRPHAGHHHAAAATHHTTR